MKKAFEEIAIASGYDLEICRKGCYTNYTFIKGEKKIFVSKTSRKDYKALQMDANFEIVNPTNYVVYHFDRPEYNGAIITLADGKNYANLSFEEIESIIRSNE